MKFKAIIFFMLSTQVLGVEIGEQKVRMMSIRLETLSAPSLTIKRNIIDVIHTLRKFHLFVPSRGMNVDWKQVDKLYYWTEARQIKARREKKYYSSWPMNGELIHDLVNVRIATYEILMGTNWVRQNLSRLKKEEKQRVQQIVQKHLKNDQKKSNKKKSKKQKPEKPKQNKSDKRDQKPEPKPGSPSPSNSSSAEAQSAKESPEKKEKKDSDQESKKQQKQEDSSDNGIGNALELEKADSQSLDLPIFEPTRSTQMMGRISMENRLGKFIEDVGGRNLTTYTDYTLIKLGLEFRNVSIKKTGLLGLLELDGVVQIGKEIINNDYSFKAYKYFNVSPLIRFFDFFKIGLDIAYEDLFIGQLNYIGGGLGLLHIPAIFAGPKLTFGAKFGKRSVYFDAYFNRSIRASVKVPDTEMSFSRYGMRAEAKLFKQWGVALSYQKLVYDGVKRANNFESWDEAFGLEFLYFIR